jgi:hypothetical protein
MSKARPLPLPPSGISVWKPLSSSEGGLVAILGSGPSERAYTSDEDVQCVWCGLRSRQAAACEVCGSPLYDSIAIWQPESSAQLEAPPAPIRNESVPPAPASSRSAPTPTAVKWPGAGPPPPSDSPSDQRPEPRAQSRPSPSVNSRHDPSPPETRSDTVFKAFRRFAGLEIQWVRRDPTPRVPSPSVQETGSTASASGITNAR